MTRGALSTPKNMLAAIRFYAYTSVFGRLPANTIRIAYLRSVLNIRIGDGAFVAPGCFVTGRNIQIGCRSVINRRVYLDGRGWLRIGDNVSVSPECYILTLTHDTASPTFAACDHTTEIDDFCWLGARALVMPGIHIGRGAVIGAGSVVTKNIAPNEIVAGNPARVIGHRPDTYSYELNYFPLLDTDIQL